jgi:GNAT superfamily N-acetyltransferase
MPKKTAAQLDREIEAALSRPRPGRAHARSLFPSDRDRALEYLADGGFEKLYAGATKRGEPFEIYGSPTGSYSIRLADTLREIGTAYLAEKWSDEGVHQGRQDYVSIVRVEPAYKRQGIATALYEAIEEHTGRPLRPSPTDQSDEAKAFWAARARRSRRA